jgi:hypothetical protein
MSSPNPLSFNAWVQTIGTLTVATTVETAGVWGFVDAPLQQLVPQILAYAESRIARDLDMLSSQTSNTYALAPGQSVFSLPVGDFQTVQTLEIIQSSGAQVVNSCPLTFVSKEFIQNCYSGLTQSSTPKFAALYGDNFGDEQDSFTNILLGPPPNFAYSLRVTGTACQPSLYTNATSGPADSAYTYISNYYPDMLVMASMIFISAFQRNFSATSDDPAMPMNYEKQYQALRLGAIPLENRRKQQSSGWSAYSTPPSATPTR